MSFVNKGTGRMIARLPLSDDIGFGIADALADVGHELELRVVGFAAEHIDSGEFLESIGTQFDRRSPSGKDVLVYSDDPHAVSIEFGHVDRVEIRHDGRLIGYRIVPVQGVHAFSRAMNSLPTVE